MATAISSSGLHASSDAYIATAAGVASLDTPQLNQTKLEIRTLVSEVANLASSDLSWSDFLDATLPRICQAMGASAAAVWEVDGSDRLSLAGHCRLPSSLLPVASSDQSAPADESCADHHQRILACVASEGSAVLVPPRSTKLSADRPANPLDESLLIVPIKIFERHETLLEVIQPHSGGPAAQRGYLRFVAQMADLVAEHLRLRELRRLARDSDYVQQLRRALSAVGAATNEIERLQLLTSSWANMLGADLAIALHPKPSSIPGFRSRKWQVTAISDVKVFDARSEIVQAAQAWVSSSAEPPRPQIISANPQVLASDPSVNSHESATHVSARLCELLGCETLVRVAIADRCQVILAVSGAIELPTIQSRTLELSQAFTPLLSSSNLFAKTNPLKSQSGWQRVERWVVRASTVLLVVSLAMFPVPDSLSTVAVLEAVDKQFYFAPANATVGQVLVDSHAQIKQGESMIHLIDPQLQAKIEELEGQQLGIAAQLEQDRATVLRGQQSGRATEEDLRARIEQSKLSLSAINGQLDILRRQAEELTVRCKSDGLVTTWDARNRLQGRPVTAGQLLLTTYAPTTNWQLKLSIPERQIGRIEKALSASKSGLDVQFSLSSHPGQVCAGRLISLSKQLIKDQAGSSSVLGIVRVQADQLPAPTDGAVARAAIDCGRTFALWLLVRDAYRQATTWWRLL